MNKLSFDAVIFDLDGVITKTARVHSAAWTEMFNAFLKTHAERTGEPCKPFRHVEDYLPYVDGRPRYQGVQFFLESRRIDLPYGTPDDPPDAETICGLGNRKNEIFNQLIREGQVEVFPSTIELIHQLKQRDVRIGVASSSKNCKTILEVTGLLDLFETRVDGVVSAVMNLTGKPAPDIFCTASDNLGAAYDRTVIVEDAVSGVQAGRKGNFGLVLGLAREDNAGELRANGADIVVEDLAETSLERLEQWFTEGLPEDGWALQYHDYLAEEEQTRETLLAVGNGYMGTRGAFEELSANDINYPGTYLAGVYNRLETEMMGRTISNEDFVNCPNWLLINFKVDDGNWLDLNQVEILEIERRLDFRDGVLYRKIVVQDEEGRITAIDSKRMASMDEPHLAALQYQITPQNYSGKITIQSGLNGDIINDGVARYRQLNARHLMPVTSGGEGRQSDLVVVTNQSNIQIALASSLAARKNGKTLSPEITHTSLPGAVYASFDVQIGQNETLAVDKWVAIYTSKDHALADPLVQAIQTLIQYQSFDQVHRQSAEAWRNIWDQVDIQVDGDRLTQKLVRLHLYHMFVTASVHNPEIDAGIPARGLHGESYRGHIFWDEMYILPLYNLHFPQVSRAALMYRYRRLDQARMYAAEFGYQGAMFPWQSGSDGREETPTVHLNPLSGKWGADNSSLQRHVSIAIAYNIWQYHWITEDDDFLISYGAEMFLEICRFWASAASLNPQTKLYDIDQVMGPDEFHEKYPEAEEGGIKNNAYTNIMVAWLFDRAADLLGQLESAQRGAIFQKINLTEEEVKLWDEIKQHIHIPVDEGGVLEQFEGFFHLKELDWERYRQTYQDIARMDRILKSEGKSPDAYQVLKQADALMTFFILSEDQIRQTIKRAGYDWPENMLAVNYDYYFPRTSHGSTLSRLVHAYLAAKMGNEATAWQLYTETLISDYQNIQGNTTGEGIHTGVMAGSVYNLLRSYAGLRFDKPQLHICPSLPSHWRSLKFNVNFRGFAYQFILTPNKVKVKLANSEKKQNSVIIIFEQKISINNKIWTEIDF